MKKPSRYIFRPEVLDRVGVSGVTLWEWMRSGQFPICREINKRSAWLEADIDKFIATRPERKYKPPSASPPRKYKRAR